MYKEFRFSVLNVMILILNTLGCSVTVGNNFRVKFEVSGDFIARGYSLRVRMILGRSLITWIFIYLFNNKQDILPVDVHTEI